MPQAAPLLSLPYVTLYIERWWFFLTPNYARRSSSSLFPFFPSCLCPSICQFLSLGSLTLCISNNWYSSQCKETVGASPPVLFLPSTWCRTNNTSGKSEEITAEDKSTAHFSSVPSLLVFAPCSTRSPLLSNDFSPHFSIVSNTFCLSFDRYICSSLIECDSITGFCCKKIRNDFIFLLIFSKDNMQQQNCLWLSKIVEFFCGLTSAYRIFTLYLNVWTMNQIKKLLSNWHKDCQLNLVGT